MNITDLIEQYEAEHQGHYAVLAEDVLDAEYEEWLDKLDELEDSTGDGVAAYEAWLSERS